MSQSYKNTEILAKLTTYLKSLQEVGTCWLEGSFAREEQDNYSDIDLWIDCENNKEELLLNKVIDFLKNNFKLDFKDEFIAVHNYHQDHSEILQHYLICDDFILDLCIQSRSRTVKLVFSANEEVRILFDKNKLLKFSSNLIDEKYNSKNLYKIQNWILAKSQVILKKAARGEFLPVCNLYFDLLKEIVEYYLILNQAKKTYSVYKDSKYLEPKIVKCLENLHKIQNIEDIILNLQHLSKKIKTSIS